MDEIVDIPFRVENVKPLENYQEYFSQSRAGIKKTLEASAQTQYGKEELQGTRDHSIMTLEDFQRLPQLQPQDLAVGNDRFVQGQDEHYHKVTTSGSSGVAKEILHRESDMVVKVDIALENAIRAAKHPAILQDKDSFGTSRTVIKRSFDDFLDKPIDVLKFTFPDELIRLMINENIDLGYLSINPTLARLFMIGLEGMYKNNDPLLKGLKGKKFMMELAGEPVELEELKKWDTLLDNVFGELNDDELPRIVSIYGLSETLMIGIYRHTKNSKAISYEVKPNTFCLVLDENNQPITGKPGQIEVTKLITDPTIANGTVLPRYLTGDIATAEFKDGKLFLTDVHRNPEKAQLSIAGDKLPLDSLSTEMSKRGYPVQIRYGILSVHDSAKAEMVLNIEVLTGLKQDFDNLSKTKNEIFQIIKEYYSFILGAVKGGLLKINLIFSPGQIEKSWQLLKNSTISLEEYKKIVSTPLHETFTPLPLHEITC